MNPPRSPHQRRAASPPSFGRSEKVEYLPGCFFLSTHVSLWVAERMPSKKGDTRLTFALNHYQRNLTKQPKFTAVFCPTYCFGWPNAPSEKSSRGDTERPGLQVRRFFWRSRAFSLLLFPLFCSPLRSRKWL